MEFEYSFQNWQNLGKELMFALGWYIHSQKEFGVFWLVHKDSIWNQFKSIFSLLRFW
jgi:hypothetical protein